MKLKLILAGRLLLRYMRLLGHYLPVIAPILLVAINALIDNGSLSLAPHTLSFLNAILAALGLGALHIRTKTPKTSP